VPSASPIPPSRATRLARLALAGLLLAGLTVGCREGEDDERAERGERTEHAATSAAPASTAAADAQGHVASTTAAGPVPAAVVALGEHGEDLYDAVNAGRWPKAQALLDSARSAARSLPASSSGLAATAQGELPGVLDSLAQAIASKQQARALALANRVTYMATELTRPYAQAVPVEVQLLDYYGRELELGASAKDQARITQAATDIQRTWSAVKPAVEQHGGQKQATHTDALVTKIIAAQTPAEAGRLARSFLDEVDDLEKVFTKR